MKGLIMARLDYPDPMQPAVADVLAHLPDLHLFRILGHAETALMPWLSLGGALLSTLSLEPVLRELVILQVAAATGADYERIQHEAIAADLGVGPAVLAAIREGRLDDEPGVTEHAAVLHVVERLVRSHTATESEFTMLHGQLDQRQIVELLMVVGFYLGLAVLINAVELDPDSAAHLAVQAGNTDQDGNA
jgi:alkylhydroperoxidase family enzyme